MFGLDYKMALSTRPEGYLGELEVWNEAEAALEEALNATGREWEMNPGDGAFYGAGLGLCGGGAGVGTGWEWGRVGAAAALLLRAPMLLTHHGMPPRLCLPNPPGPKIDITVYDALRRKFQCATVQLDFQLPIRFNLEYVAEDGSYQRPVIVHRWAGGRGGR